MSIHNILSTWSIHENAKIIKMRKSQNTKLIKIMSKNMKNRGGLNPALKPGPVVPPGTQKTPDQAARISQSAVFGHLSDILAILGGVSFFDLFLYFFTFLILMILCFFILLILSLFHFFTFSCFITFCVLLIFVNFCHFLLLVMNFDHFLSLN